MSTKSSNSSNSSSEAPVSKGGAESGGLRRPPRPGGNLKSERVQEELKTAPGWRSVAGGRALGRTRRFGNALAAARFAAFAAELAAMERHELTVGICGKRVTLALQRPSRSGINLHLIDCARQIG